MKTWQTDDFYITYAIYNILDKVGVMNVEKKTVIHTGLTYQHKNKMCNNYNYDIACSYSTSLRTITACIK